MSKLDDKDLSNIAAGTGSMSDLAPDDHGGAPDHGTIEDNSPPPGGSPGLEDEGQGGGSSGIGQG